MQKFTEIPYTRPDLDAFKRQSLALIEQLEQAGDAAQARQTLLKLQDLEAGVDTAVTLAHVRNTIDTTDAFYDAEMTFLNEALPTLIKLQISYLKA